MRIFVTITIICFLGLILTYSCRKHSQIEGPVSTNKTFVIAHHAYSDANIDSHCIQTYSRALNFNDGIEVDVQMSQDRTLWLYHNSKMDACGTIKAECLITKKDAEIEALATCLGTDFRYTKLDEVLELMSKTYPEKYISLDIKTWFDGKSTIYGNNILAYYHNIALKIIESVGKYKMEHRVMVESEVAYLLGKIKRRSSIPCYLSAFGDFRAGFRKVLNLGYAGISFQYMYKEEVTVEDIQNIHQKGLKIQLWVVNADSNMQKALLLKPDFIQTDKW